MAALLSSCSPSLLLDSKFLGELASGPPEKLETVYFTRHYTWTGRESLVMKTHRVLRIGSNRAATPEVLTVHDGFSTRLTHFEAQLVRPGGLTESYDQSDLTTYALSSRAVIADWYIKYVPLAGDLPPGTLIETVSMHEMLLAPLGASFSLSEVGSEGRQISCMLTVPRGAPFFYRVFNDSITPTIDTSMAGITYTFRWKSYQSDSKPWPFRKENTEPELLASLSPIGDTESGNSHGSEWVPFGNWYLDLVESRLRQSDRLKTLAQEITRDKTTALEKINAIFEYCQRNVRYEQVYLTLGEFIPNDPHVILDRKYGDCKDYSLLIFLLARSVGLDPHLALCYRGRGVEVYPQVPVSQFNHMVVHFEYDGINYWYDGTNRRGLPGITTIDLLNTPALLLQRDKTRFVTITESPANLLTIEGTFIPFGPSLKGRLSVSLHAQYAIDFFVYDLYLNRAKMTERVVQWIRSHLHPDVALSAVDWERREQDFVFLADIVIPNCLTSVEAVRFTSISRILPALFPLEDPALRPEDLFFFPTYNKVNIALDVPRLKDPTSRPASMRLAYDVPAGPFSTDTRHDFLERYQAVHAEFTETLRFVEEVQQ